VSSCGRCPPTARCTGTCGRSCQRSSAGAASWQVVRRRLPWMFGATTPRRTVGCSRRGLGCARVRRSGAGRRVDKGPHRRFESVLCRTGSSGSTPTNINLNAVLSFCLGGPMGSGPPIEHVTCQRADSDLVGEYPLSILRGANRRRPTRSSPFTSRIFLVRPGVWERGL
jgi:hypothetical protein